jgi:anthranilate phosphoribosyltransferase
MSIAFKPLLAKVATGASLSETEAESAFATILSGESTPAQTGAFLMALRVRGESVAEMTGAVKAMRERMLRVQAPAGAIDIVGTGGDQAGTWNVSTLAAIIAAACGVPIAKHGNRAASSRSGAADVLTSLGVKIGLDAPATEACLAEAGLAFMFAQTHHASMRHVAAVRIEMGTRTIFNLLGPQANPASVKRQVLGVFAEGWLLPIAETLRNLGSDRVWVIHGSDGLDELTTTGPSKVVALDGGKISQFTVTPEQAGLPLATPEALKGGDPATNANALRAVLDGAKTAYRDIAVLNAAAGLVVAGKVPDLKQGAELAAKAVDSGAARAKLEQLVAVSNRF